MYSFKTCKPLILPDLQDDGAFAIAQALKANEDVTVTSINLGNNFITKFGQVRKTCISRCPHERFMVAENLHFVFVLSRVRSRMLETMFLR